jgi:hypothetical protein
MTGIVPPAPQGPLIAALGYHGSISGTLKNAPAGDCVSPAIAPIRPTPCRAATPGGLTNVAC